MVFWEMADAEAMIIFGPWGLVYRSVGLVEGRFVCQGVGREHADALLLGVGVGHEALEGERLALGEVEDGAFVRAPEADLLVEAPGLVGSGHNEEDGDIDVPREGGKGHGHAVGEHLQPDM